MLISRGVITGINVLLPNCWVYNCYRPTITITPVSTDELDSFIIS